MTATEAPAAGLTGQQLALIYQYTVEAYKSFEKLAESLPNPMAAKVFTQFAVDERETRDLIEMKVAAATHQKPVRVTLGPDMIFGQLLEGELSYREAAEFLIAREKTMQNKLRELIRNSAPADRSLLVFLESGKRAHIVELERELELIRIDSDWWKREDAEWRLVNGAPPA